MGSATQDQHRGMSMSKPARGTKRVCPSCGARFYDLNRTPIVCPACQYSYQITPPPPPSRRWQRARPVETRKVEEQEAKAPVLEDQRSALKRPKREQARFPSRRTRRSLISGMTEPRFPQVMTRTPSWKKRRKARPTCQGSSAATRTGKEGARVDELMSASGT